MIKTDVVIVGAGPCGLFQVFELGLLGLKAEIVDSLRQPGGQCTELYPDKPIYDIPAIPMCTGEELTTDLLKQIEPFPPGMHLGEEVTVVRVNDDETFYVETRAGKQFEAKAIVIAAGVGSFQPRGLRVPDVEQYEGKSLHYRVRDPEKFAGKRLVILGGGDSALDWVVELAGIAEHITLVHRRDEYRAVPATVETMRGLESQGKVTTIESAKAKAITGKDGMVESITIQPKEGDAVEVPADDVLVFFGLAPKLGPIAEWGLDINRKTINVDTEKFETSTPGIYAVGDINYYPGKKKLILCGFHEAALAAFAIKQRIEPDKKVHVQYTTTSPIMHERLGVED
ncbi:MAG: NAD(P)/FAD-dependent oxidoreductase [Gammaproteobacteria bacterium]|nr:NAD(P)/FAD-dependent oxidoreductase [Gammaproteobacteria bacterium]MBT8095333.1 NAD(P)/FAD-dependent oxidoreductase [Gammaproteobacteria bacterium]MBT8105531.1 NAD(P)/FAD-dependent oxidoreductase [Gammaproteobacteria bacterium]NNF49960.1 NAD(P)/FAD-dependent oxidoreductase [Woeseiaceae bacterium]NNK25545.1 NAD(P)/FAD-dependent oxidoreductase [Woeseiaceae bacterium]